MFKKFKELFGSESLLDAAYNTTLKMLEFDFKMFTASKETLREHDTSELPFDVHQMDRKINKFERKVRRDVLTHLTIAGTQNLVPGLVLVSIVIDVERIGDFTKNIADLAAAHPKRLKGGPFEKSLTELEQAVSRQFPEVLEVLGSQSKTLGRSIMRAENAIGKRSDQIVMELIKGTRKRNSLSVSDAVSVAIYARYLKRINAHITNIASAIVNPFPRISFREKKKPAAI